MFVFLNQSSHTEEFIHVDCSCVCFQYFVFAAEFFAYPQVPVVDSSCDYCLNYMLDYLLSSESFNPFI